MKKAFVTVAWRDSGASMAGGSPGTVPMADVFEVEADSQEEAEKLAIAKANKNPMAGGVRARFLRWSE